jgi:hypothetical protein
MPAHRPSEAITDQRRRSALEQAGIDIREKPALTDEQVRMASVAARTLQGYPPSAQINPPIAIDPEHLEALAVIHCTLAEMAGILHVSEAVLRNPVNRAIIERGNARGKQSLRRAQWTAALSGNVTAQIWLGKNELGQRDNVEVTGAGGGAIQIESPQAALMERMAQIRERRSAALLPGDGEEIRTSETER